MLVYDITDAGKKEMLVTLAADSICFCFTSQRVVLLMKNSLFYIESFVKVKKWVKELRKIVGNDIAIAIAGNKVDLEKNRHVDKQEALEYVYYYQNCCDVSLFCSTLYHY